VESPEAEYYITQFSREADLGKRRDLLRKATEAVPDLLERANKSGYPDAIWYAHAVFSKILVNSAQMETDSDAKSKMLEKALEQNDEGVRIVEQIAPSMYWERGIIQKGLGMIKSQLADLSLDSAARVKVLLEAVSHFENSCKLLANGVVSLDKKGSAGTFWVLAGTHYYRGILLGRIYDLTEKRGSLANAIEAFEAATDYYQKLNLNGGAAECQWKTAQTYDRLGEHLKASESFQLASNYYKDAAEKTHQLKTLYVDHAFYMLAWSEIEKARYHHEREEYGPAKEHFEKAANLHKSLKQWGYLAPNYFAWAEVESGEELSRNEQCEESIKVFEKASKLLIDSKKTLQTQMSKIEDADEKQMATSMIRASDLRKEYCRSRIALEEAKILDKKGDHYSSSEKYGSAADAFEKISQKSESEQDRKELELIITLSRAWQKTTLAEARSSAALYREASEIFEQAEDLSSNEKTKLLILGHSRFCKALETGTRFVDSRDPSLHQITEQYLESAADYYLKAGFQNASEYSNAMEHLFDAYLYMDDARKEKDPEKKAKLYTMAEKILQTSAGSFMKAEHPEKSGQVSRLLDKAREEKELALSLSEVLHAPSIVSTTTAFRVPPPTQENPVGLERFENAHVLANLITRQKEVKIGELLTLKLELVNAGKSPALLIKIDEVIPEGFELDEEPETWRVEDSCINMKGKRLDPLKAEELRLVLKPKVQGTFHLRPTIFYLDENGKYKTHESEPVTVTVKELGVKGWLKGET